MCGRITITVSPDEIVRWLGVDPGRYFEPRYNIAPTQFVAVVRINSASGLVKQLHCGGGWFLNGRRIWPSAAR